MYDKFTNLISGMRVIKKIIGINCGANSVTAGRGCKAHVLPPGRKSLSNLNQNLSLNMERKYHMQGMSPKRGMDDAKSSLNLILYFDWDRVKLL